MKYKQGDIVYYFSEYNLDEEAISMEDLAIGVWQKPHKKVYKAVITRIKGNHYEIAIDLDDGEFCFQEFATDEELVEYNETTKELYGE